MKTIITTGITIGLSCAAWTFVMGFTGWYKHQNLLHLFWVVVVIQIALLIYGLRATSLEGRRYWSQVGAGTTMSLVAAVIIFAGSLLFTMVVFPDYFAELRQLHTQILQAEGKTAAEIESAIAAVQSSQTPLAQAAAGAIGTTVTGFVCSLIIAAFYRAKGK